MKQINKVNANTPDAYDLSFKGMLGVQDMERHYKLSKHFKEGSYLDVGCFDSIMPILLAENPKNKVYALDHSPKLIAFLKQRFPKVNYIVGKATKLPFQDGTLDYVCAGELIEHLDNPHHFIKEAFRVLKKGGWLAVSTPNEEVDNKIGGIYHMWKFDVGDIKKLLDINEVEILLEESNRTILGWKQK